MEKRKNPEKDVRRLSGLFFQVGLLAALMLVVSAFEYRTAVDEDHGPIVLPDEVNVIETILPTVQEERKQPVKPPSPKTKMMNPVADPEPEAIQKDLKDVMPIDEVAVTVNPGDIVVDIIDEPEEPTDIPFSIVEQMPTPVGGNEALYAFINKKLRYPSQARRIGVQGTVFLSFVVDRNGKMVDIEIAKGIGAGCDEEVLRIFEKNPPKWNPGKQRGVPVKVKQMIPVKFILN